MSERFKEQNYYELLEISPQATEEEIKRAYMRARDTYSPDSPALYTMFTPDEARDLMNMIEDAYQVLSNKAKRADYDRRIELGELGDLPDFMPPEEVQGAQRPAPTQTSTSPVRSGSEIPEGCGRTPFGVYEKDEGIEDEIINTSQYDGEFLRRVRIYKKVSVEQISDRTRISRTYLKAIENNDYQNLPAPVFVRGFVVQMARLLGLPENEVATSYMNLFKRGRQQ